MKHFGYRWMAVVMALLLVCLPIFAQAEEGNESGYRTDVTEADYIGTWELKSMIMQGYLVPSQTLGIHATVVIEEGKITITDVLDVTKSYETAFEDGRLTYTDGVGMEMAVYITEDGLLHIEKVIRVFSGTAEDEDSPIEKGGSSIDIDSMDTSILDQYFAKVEDN